MHFEFVYIYHDIYRMWVFIEDSKWWNTVILTQIDLYFIPESVFMTTMEWKFDSGRLSVGLNGRLIDHQIWGRFPALVQINSSYQWLFEVNVS